MPALTAIATPEEGKHHPTCTCPVCCIKRKSSPLLPVFFLDFTEGRHFEQEAPVANQWRRDSIVGQIEERSSQN